MTHSWKWNKLQTMQNLQTKPTKPHLPNQTYQSKPTKRDQDRILADEQHKQFLYLGVWAPWITILSMEY